MAYIGNPPTIGQWRKLDDISGSFNGSTTTFTTSVGGSNVTAGSANQLIVSLGGVIQQPNVDYSVTTNSLIFTTAPASGLDFFAVLAGDALNAAVPADGTITTAKLAGNLTVDLDSGSAAAPSLTFDSNTGLFSPAPDEVSISTGGTERLKIDSTGQIGAVSLGTAGAPTFSFTGDTNTGVYSPGADQVAISTNSTGRLFIDSSGRVGVGTSAPQKNLEISASTGATLRLNSSASAVTASDVLGAIEFYSNDGSAAATGIAASIEVSPTSAFGQGGVIRLKTRDEVTANAVERVTVDQGGRVGIGTSSPSQRLTVAGNILTTSAAGTDSYVNVTTTGVQNTYLGFNNSGSTNSNSVLNNYSYVGAGNAYGLQLLANGTPAVTIDTSQRVGIGTSSANVRLHVNVDSASETDVARFQASNGADVQFLDIGVDPTGNLVSYDATGSTGGAHVFRRGGSEVMRLDDSSRLLIGTSTATGRLSVAVADGTTTVFSAERTGGSPASLTLAFTNQETNWASSVRYNLIAGGSGGVTLASGATSWAAISDERLKTDLIDIQDGLNKITSLRAVTGRYISDSEETRRAFLIAQDVQTVLPEAVDSSNPDELRLLYTEVIPLLVSALKESKERIETLEAKVAALESA